MYETIKTAYVIGRVTYKAIRDFILDNKVQESETIFLNTYDFDDLVLDFRDFYSSAMPSDIKILGITMKEDRSISTRGRVIIASRVTSTIPQSDEDKEDGFHYRRLARGGRLIR